jgi:ubiquinone/menaquinone biosynthesis C-methylase UbiE
MRKAGGYSLRAWLSIAPMPISRNLDPKTVQGFGEEWAAFDQKELSESELLHLFEAYFSLFTFNPRDEGFDLGCGSGRWARFVAPKVGKLHCIDPAPKALAVARSVLAGHDNVEFHEASSDTIPLPDGSQDFGYSLGVLHHIPDTEAGMRDCVRKLKPGAPFLVYLYYRFDQRSVAFRALWRASDVLRRAISRLPFGAKKAITSGVAAIVYLPLARTARLLENRGHDVDGFPLSAYRRLSFYSMRTDALDRLGTRLEHRFTRPEIEAMMQRCGLDDIRFRDSPPYWVACGRKESGGSPV